jgi:iron complex outermembrane receptor protein
MKKLLSIFLIFFTFSLYAQVIDLEKIVIQKDISSDSFVFDSFEIESLPSFSLEEVVDYSSSIDLRKRSPFGIQQDVSLRGSIFEDTNIFLEGIKINDPQTGHFNLEIPLTSADLEEVEVFKNIQAINFSLKKPKEQGIVFRSFFGQHALWENLFSFNFPLKKIKNRISIEHKISSGSRQDTDFEIYNFSFHSFLEKEGKESEFLFASTKRDFGADKFYATNYPFEEEHINQRFSFLRIKTEGSNFSFQNTFYARRHQDKYILNRHNPPFYTNYHTTYIYGLKSEIDFCRDFFFILEAKREKITSTNLGNHRRLNKGISLGIKNKKINKFLFNFLFSLNYYESWRYLDEYHLKIDYPLKNNLNLKFSFAHLWRVPSFTEKYYSSPSNKGNASLKVQKTNNFEIGVNYQKDNLNLGIDTFYRKQFHTIDWVKNDVSSPWQATNIGKLGVFGLDAYLKFSLPFNFFKNFSLSYTYLDLDRNAPYTFSKYVFDYSQHKVVNTLSLEIFGFSFNFITNFSHPSSRNGYTTFDLKIAKRIKNFKLILEGVNIFNKDYEELSKVEGSSRWFKIGIEYRF